VFFLVSALSQTSRDAAGRLEPTRDPSQPATANDQRTMRSGPSWLSVESDQQDAGHRRDEDGLRYLDDRCVPSL